MIQCHDIITELGQKGKSAWKILVLWIVFDAQVVEHDCFDSDCTREVRCFQTSYLGLFADMAIMIS